MARSNATSTREEGGRQAFRPLLVLSLPLHRSPQTAKHPSHRQLSLFLKLACRASLADSSFRAQSINSSFTLLTTYVLLVPLTYTMAPRYGITNVAIIGCLYLPQGVGNIVGSRIGGKYADWTVAKWIEKRGYVSGVSFRTL